VSVPPLFTPYGIVNPATGKTFHYYDGEVREPLSIHVARDTGADFVIASSIWNPQSFDEKVGSLADYGMGVIARQALHQIIEQKVHREREQSGRFDRLLELVDAHGARHGLAPSASGELRQQICELLNHRPVKSLYVLPDPADSEFFFQGFFQFGQPVVDRCIDSGYRAYRRAIADNQSFLAELDRALTES